MKRIELNGYAVNAVAHPAEEGARMLVLESHTRDAAGLPAEIIVLGLSQEVADELAKKLAGDEIVIARTMPPAGFNA
jgi:hypothetical protein